MRIAIRPIPGDHLSAIGPIPRTSGYYIAITHRRGAHCPGSAKLMMIFIQGNPKVVGVC